VLYSALRVVFTLIFQKHIVERFNLLLICFQLERQPILHVQAILGYIAITRSLQLSRPKLSYTQAQTPLLEFQGAVYLKPYLSSGSSVWEKGEKVEDARHMIDCERKRQKAGDLWGMENSEQKLEKNRDVTSRLGGGILGPKTVNFIETANRTVTDFSRLLKGTRQ